MKTHFFVNFSSKKAYRFMHEYGSQSIPNVRNRKGSRLIFIMRLDQEMSYHYETRKKATISNPHETNMKFTNTIATQEKVKRLLHIK